MNAREQAQWKWDHVAKPLHALGLLEELIVKIAGIQETADVRIDKRCALVFCADDGLFDMINYGVLKVIKLVQSEKRRSNFPKTFYEYRKMKSESRNGGFGYLLITGCAFIVLAVVFLLLSEM